jgi:hypothetical protein
MGHEGKARHTQHHLVFAEPQSPARGYDDHHPVDHGPRLLLAGDRLS